VLSRSAKVRISSIGWWVTGFAVRSPEFNYTFPLTNWLGLPPIFISG
jgi:hypothetical protein